MQARRCSSENHQRVAADRAVEVKWRYPAARQSELMGSSNRHSCCKQILS